MMLPWATALDVEYIGLHAYNVVEKPDINAIDFGTAFQAAYQDRTLSSAIPGAAAVTTDAMRTFRGYGSISQYWARGWNTSHTLQISLNRRFRNGLSFGFNDTIVLSQTREHDSAAAAQPGRHLLRARRPGAGRQAPRRLRVVPAPSSRATSCGTCPTSPRATTGAEGGRPAAQRLAALRRLDGADRLGLHRGRLLRQRRRQREHHRLAELRGPGPHRRPDRLGLQQRPVRQFNYTGFAAPEVGSVGLESGSGLPARLLPAARSTCRSRATSGSAARATCRSASTCSTRRTRRGSPGATRRCRSRARSTRRRPTCRSTRAAT